MLPSVKDRNSSIQTIIFTPRPLILFILFSGPGGDAFPSHSENMLIELIELSSTTKTRHGCHQQARQAWFYCNRYNTCEGQVKPCHPLRHARISLTHSLTRRVTLNSSYTQYETSCRLLWLHIIIFDNRSVCACLCAAYVRCLTLL